MTRNDIYQISPAGGLGEQWMESTPLGNGLTGVAIFGGCRKETMIFGRHDLWTNARVCEIPDLSGELQNTRRLFKEGKYGEACGNLCSKLKEKGYNPNSAILRSVGQVTVSVDCPDVYNHYRRILHLDKGEAEITYNLGAAPYRRRTFVSRKRDITVCNLECGNLSDIYAFPSFFESNESVTDVFKKRDSDNLKYRIIDDGVVYSTKNDDGLYFGLVVRAVSNGKTLSSMKALSKHDPGFPFIKVENATNATLFISAFSAEKSREAGEKKAIEKLGKAMSFDYDYLLLEHSRQHKKLYNTADIKLYNGRKFHSNEELIAAAKEDSCPIELAEKLWRFGRYLFISGTNEKGNPFPLYGIWSCGYYRPWTQNVGNENVEIIHWHLGVGGLHKLIKPLIHYYYRQMDTAREVASKIFGCKGIFISTYTTPATFQMAPVVPVITHFCGTAGWLCRHFYEYYQLTKDEELLQKEIIPLMLETAAFYEDYVGEENGNILIFPGVSPENSPMEFMGGDFSTASGHPMPVTKNPTIEIAILKELLTHLLELGETHSLPSDRMKKWKDMLGKIPDYRINSDGAIAEWLEENYTDNYFHRHLSHLYPVFPGTEIVDSGKEELLPYFRKAVDLRILGSMTGWSIAHMAAIYARLGDAYKVSETITMLTKVCLLPNLFTLHNDYRGMGITSESIMSDSKFAPVQLDAAMGTVNAVQEMLAFVTPSRVHLLPALPKEWKKGSAELHIFGGKISFAWNIDNKTCKATVTSSRDMNLTLRMPFGAKETEISLKQGEKQTLEI